MHSDIWKKIYDNSTDGIVILESLRDNKGKIIDFIFKYINESGSKISHVKKKDLIDKRLLEIREQSFENGLFDDYVKVVETGITLNKERMVVSSGKSIWYRTITVKIDNALAVVFSDITKQKELEKQLLESETYLRKITESIPQLVWIATPDGVIEYYNRRWYEYTDMEAESFDERKFLSLIHPDDRKQAQKKWQYSLKSGNPYEIECRIINGVTKEYRWFLVRALPIKNEHNKIMNWFGSCTDIHLQKIAAESQRFLAEASKLLSASLNYKTILPKVAKLAVPHISDWISIEMYDGKNVELAALAHFDPQKVKWGRNLRKERPVDMKEDTGLPYVLKSGKPLLFPLITPEMIQAAVKSEKELRLINEIGFTSLMIVPIIAHKTTIGAIQFVSTDSKRQFNRNDLQMAEELASRIALSIQNSNLYEELKQRETLFHSLYDSNIIGVVYEDSQGKVKDANDAFFNLIGYHREEFTKKQIDWGNLTPSEYLDLDKEKRKELLKTGVATPYEKEYVRKDGTKIPVIVGIALLDKNNQSSLAFILDITERKKLESRKDEFIGIASHELKTPLTSIKGYVQILERIIQEMGDEKARLLVTKTNTYIDKLNSLIVDLLDVSKIQAGKLQFTLERFDLGKLVQESVQAIQPTTSHTITSGAILCADIEGDRHRLDQVMANLLTNAIKYSPQGKEVIVTMEKCDNFVQVNVQDFGIGIEDQYKQLLFQRFYRVEASARQFSGLGIGLYISSEIISRHGGKVWFESSPGIGSTFHFKLPLIKE